MKMLNIRVKEANARLDTTGVLRVGPVKRIELLDRQLGVGVGATRERKRLQAWIDTATTVVAIAKREEVVSKPKTVKPKTAKKGHKHNEQNTHA